MEEEREDVHERLGGGRSRQGTAGKTWKELEKAAMERKQWKSLVAALCAS